MKARRLLDHDLRSSTSHTMYKVSDLKSHETSAATGCLVSEGCVCGRRSSCTSQQISCASCKLAHRAAYTSGVIHAHCSAYACTDVLTCIDSQCCLVCLTPLELLRDHKILRSRENPQHRCAQPSKADVRLLRIGVPSAIHSGVLLR